jgi:hypothetical protein
MEEVILNKLIDMDKKMDTLYSSDLLSKKMLDDHERRITKLELQVSESEDTTYNNS